MKGYRFEIFDRFFVAHWFLTGYFSRSFSELLRAGGSRSLTVFIGVMEDDITAMIFDSQEFNRAADYYANKLMNNRRWRARLYARHHADLRRYFATGEQLRQLPFPSMTAGQIVRAAEPVMRLQERVRVLGIMLNGLVLDGRHHLSNKLRRELQPFFTDEKKFERDWAALTQVTRLSIRQKKELAIAKLASQTQRLAPRQPDARLRKLYQQYCWLDYMYYGPPTTWESFQQEPREALRENKQLTLLKDMRALQRQQGALMRTLRFSPRARFLVRLAQHVLWQKGWRKDVEYHGFYCYEPMLREIARRKGEKDWRNLLYMFPWELKNFLLKGSPTLAELKRRRNFSVLIVKGPHDVKIITGKTARKFYRGLHVEHDFSTINEVRGQCAFAGRVRGKVKIIQTPADMVKMKRGDILVSQATSPDLLPAMRKAGAIVTNTGGLICHAAITSRELKIPCVVGTATATLVFKDGDRVEVDATAGVVRKI